MGVPPGACTFSRRYNLNNSLEKKTQNQSQHKIQAQIIYKPPSAHESPQMMERDLLPPSCSEEGNTLRIIKEEVDRRENRMKGTDQIEKEEGETKYQPTKPDRGTIFSILFGVKDEYTVNEIDKPAEQKKAGKNTNVLGILIKQLRFQDKQNDCRNGRSRWMVVFASFWSYFLFAGTRGSMGIIQSEMTQALNADDVELQWTGALVNSAPLLLGMY